MPQAIGMRLFFDAPCISMLFVSLLLAPEWELRDQVVQAGRVKTQVVPQ